MALCRELADKIPALKPVFDDHLDYYEELLPHVFFGDVTRFSEDCFKSGGDIEALQQLLDILDANLADGHVDVQNLIAASFIEHHPNMAEIRSMSGARLGTEIDLMVDWYRRHGTQATDQ